MPWGKQITRVITRGTEDALLSLGTSAEEIESLSVPFLASRGRCHLLQGGVGHIILLVSLLLGACFCLIC